MVYPTLGLWLFGAANTKFQDTTQNKRKHFVRTVRPQLHNTETSIKTFLPVFISILSILPGEISFSPPQSEDAFKICTYRKTCRML